jgi:arginase family enzyme
MSAAPQATVLLAGYDGTSRVPGTSLGAECLWGAISAAAGPDAGWRARALREDTKSSALWCRKLRREASPNLLLGGEHLVTFPIVEALVARQRDLRLVVLDAHHDAYDYPLLTHYSLFHFICHELGVPTLIVGARHELELAPAGCEILSAGELRRAGPDATLDRMRRFVDNAPFYFSVDLDVLDPSEFPAVSDPVPGGVSVRELATLAREMLSLSPMAADIVEYNPLRDASGGAALTTLAPFFQEYVQWLA